MKYSPEMHVRDLVLVVHQSRPAGGGLLLAQNERHAPNRTHGPRAVLRNHLPEPISVYMGCVITQYLLGARYTLLLQWDLKVEILVAVSVGGMQIHHGLRDRDIVRLDLSQQ